jgi:hypothetical protein
MVTRVTETPPDGMDVDEGEGMSIRLSSAVMLSYHGAGDP